MNGRGGMMMLVDAKAFLAKRYSSNVERVSPLGQGEWSTAYAFRRDGADLVIRFGTLEEDFQKDRLAARFASPALPIPKIVEIGEAAAGFYAISERATGMYLDDLNEGQMRALLPSLFAALDAARLADCSSSSGYGIWAADGDAPHGSWRAALLDIANDRPGNRTHGWRERLKASLSGVEPFDTALELLRGLADALPEERHLIHSDLLNRNVLVVDNRISAVIDWGSAMYGDFVYDMAWFCFWAPWYPAWRGIDFRTEAERHYAAIGLNVPHLAERLRACQIHIGLDSMAYCAFKGEERWPMLEDVAARTLMMATGDTDAVYGVRRRAALGDP